MKKLLSNDIISLRAIEPEDIELLYSWENDPEIWEVSHTLVPFSKYILALYIQNADKDIYESKQLRLMIDTVEGKTIGAIDLFDFDPYHSRIGIGLLIYAPDKRSKGYASASLELLIPYCFQKLIFTRRMSILRLEIPLAWHFSRNLVSKPAAQKRNGCDQIPAGRMK